MRLIFTLTPRRDLPQLLGLARDLDPEMFFSVERATHWGTGYQPVLYPTGWRAFWKKK